MNRIAFTITKSEVGGAQTWVKDQIQICYDSGKFEKIILITSYEGWLCEAVRNMAEIYFISELQKSLSIYYPFKISKIFKEKK